MASNFVPILGPAFLVCVGYMDPGKWATALEGGSRFGFELVWVLVLSNVMAMILQFLSSELGLATGKNLAEVCNDKYPPAVCFLLWLQCEFSIVVLDLTMVLGIAIGLNILIGLPMVPCIFLTIIDAPLFLVCLPYVGMHRAQIFTASIVCIVLLCFVLDALHSNARTSAVLFGMLPRLRGESLYTAASIFGANITPYNFYLHSALVQSKHKVQGSSMGALLYCSLMDIILAFGAAFVINMAVLSSAATNFHNSGLALFTLQDAQALMEQMLNNSVAPAAFGLALLCAGQLSILTGTIAGQVATEGFFRGSVPVSLHRLLIKVAAVLPAVLLVWKSGSERTYQILIFSQVILALQLPFAVVPLIKATSSRAVMGQHRISFLVEALAWFFVGLMFFMNIWLVFDMLFGESDEWIDYGSWSFVRDYRQSNAKWGEALQLMVLTFSVMVTVLLTGLLMWMISTPLRGDTKKSEKSLCLEEYVALVPTLLDSEAIESMRTEVPTIPEDVIKTDHMSQNRSESLQPKEQLEAGMNLLEEYVALVPTLLDSKAIESMRTEVPTIPEDVIKTDHMSQNRSESLQPKEQLEEAGMNLLEQQGLGGKAAAEVQAAVVLDSLGDTLAIMQVSPPPIQQPEEIEHQSQEEVSAQDISFVCSLTSANASSPVVSPLTVSPTESLAGSSFVSSLAHEEMPHVGKMEARDPKAAEIGVHADLLDKDDYEVDVWENLEQEDVVPDSLSCIEGSTNSLTCEEPESGRSIGGRSAASEESGGGSGSGSLSRLSGLGRAARRQYAAVLDEFWGKLFDLHGQPSSQTSMKRQDGFTIAKIAQTGRTHQSSFLKEVYDRDVTRSLPKVSKKPWQRGFSGDQTCQIDAYPRVTSHADASTSSRFGYSHFKNSSALSASAYDASERRYSSLRFPAYHQEYDQQPATIHGYKSASYAGRSGNLALGLKEEKPMHLDAQCNVFYPSYRALDQPFESGSTHKLPRITGSGDMQSDKKLFSYSGQSLLTSQCIDESLGRSSGYPSMTGGVLSRTEIHLGSSDPSSYGTFSHRNSQWSPFRGRETKAWHPLVYRATGELDIGHNHPGASGSTLNTSFSQLPIGGGSNSQRWTNAEYLKLQSEKSPLSFDEISPSKLHKDGFSIRSSSAIENHSLWSRQPFEQLFGSPDVRAYGSREGSGCDSRHVKTLQRMPSGIDWEVDVLSNLRSCVGRLIRLEGSEWLFRMDNGSDEDLIAMVAMREKILLDAETCEPHGLYNNSNLLWAVNSGSFGAVSRSVNDSSSSFSSSGVPHCGEGCVWGIELLVSFGIWCIHRILELSFMESRPELWGKYTYVLNRLQGILELAFSKPRSVPSPCICVQWQQLDSQGIYSRQGSVVDNGSGDFANGVSMNSFQIYPHSWPSGRNTSLVKGKGASATAFIEIIKEVEAAVGARKGRSGTAAGDVAFPKGKENLASVLKRFKRRLSNKPPGSAVSGSGSGGNRRVP